MRLTRLWTAMLTRQRQDAETDSSINLSVNTNGTERLNHTFPATQQTDQEQGIANLYDVDVANRGILTEQLTDSSIRLGINGDDAWRPQHVFVFGEAAGQRSETLALAMETDITKQLSTDSSEGPSSMPLRLVGHGGANLQIRRLFILIRSVGSDQKEEDGSIFGSASPHQFSTDGPLEIQIVSQARLVVLFQIRDTPQKNLEFAEANFYTMPVIIPFTRAQLGSDSITLRIMGMDDYAPLSLFIFGADRATGRPTSLVPLVSIPDWKAAGLGVIDFDPTNGTGSITLPLAALPTEAPVVLGSQASSAGA